MLFKNLVKSIILLTQAETLNPGFWPFFPKKIGAMSPKVNGALKPTLYTLPKVFGRPLLMNRFDYFSNFYEYKS